MQDKLDNKYPLVSVFCFCKNNMKTIRRCIDSIVAQDYPNIEIIVQDGASTDGTLEILRTYGDKIKLVSEPDSSGAEALIRAMARITGEFYGSCLSDEEMLPHAVSWAVENLLKYPEVAAVYGDHYNTDIDGNITGQIRPGEWNFEKYFCSEWTPPFCASFFRTSCYKAIDLRDYTGHDEFDFWIKLSVRFPIRYVPGIVAKYAVHPGQFGCQSGLLDKQLASRKLAIEKLCNNPRTPEWIRSLRDKAIAGLYPSRAIANCNNGAWGVAKEQAPEAFRVGPNPEKLRELAELFYRHSTELYQKGQLEEALEYLDLLMEGNVAGEGLNYRRANILFKLGRINEAEKASFEELKLQPNHRSAKAIIRLAQSCTEGTVQSPDDNLAKELFKTGIKYLSQGDAVEAIKHLQEATVDCAVLPNLHFGLATALAQVGILYGARQACEIELKLQPEHDGAKRLLVRLHQAINEYEQVNMPG
jgi:tetratricopeptide (TPR) repeat protein